MFWVNLTVAKKSPDFTRVHRRFGRLNHLLEVMYNGSGRRSAYWKEGLMLCAARAGQRKPGRAMSAHGSFLAQALAEGSGGAQGVTIIAAETGTKLPV